MENNHAVIRIKQIARRSLIIRLFTIAFYALALALPAGLFLHFLFSCAMFYIIPVFLIGFFCFGHFDKVWILTEVQIANLLNQFYPVFEESCNLALLKSEDLSLLQQFQLNKITTELQRTPLNQPFFTKKFKLALLALAGSMLFFCLLLFLPIKLKINAFSQPGLTGKSNNAIPEKILPQIIEFKLLIKPPLYTRLPEYEHNKFTLNIPEGSVVEWTLKTNSKAQKVSLLFNEKENLLLSASDRNTIWQGRKTIRASGFYQVIVDGKASDLYQIQIIKDEPPLIEIKAPKQYTYIDAGEKPIVNVKVTLTDDYGISAGYINATIAKGSGEGVKFKEQKIGFSESFTRTEKKYDLQKNIDLKALGMEPGDELYFYIIATDNNKQESRTDVYIVAIQDTAQLMSMNGLVGGVNIKPEYFRSERQIIIDSQNLMKEKDTISKQNFEERSNELGTDQKLLRLRYGKFLGEESENEIGDPGKGGKDEVLSDPKDFGNGAKILDEYTDKHDNAEDAQFFEPAVKAQLKATLTEMWKAELQLRMYKPEDALPFEFKALRLLKDLQQKSRSYVAKTAYNPAPLKMEKRLSGELDKIISPSDQSDKKPEIDQFEALKLAVPILDRFKYNTQKNPTEIRILQSAYQLLGAKAITQPERYLKAVTAMQRILADDKKSLKADINTIGQAIEQILPEQKSLPQNATANPDMGLSKSYFLKLNHLKN